MTEKASFCQENMIVLRSGFWRENNETDTIYECLRSSSCLGGSENFTCDTGYLGPLCAACDLYSET